MLTEKCIVCGLDTRFSVCVPCCFVSTVTYALNIIVCPGCKDENSYSYPVCLACAKANKHAKRVSLLNSLTTYQRSLFLMYEESCTVVNAMEEMSM